MNPLVPTGIFTTYWVIKSMKEKNLIVDFYIYMEYNVGEFMLEFKDAQEHSYFAPVRYDPLTDEIRPQQLKRMTEQYGGLKRIIAQGLMDNYQLRPDLHQKDGEIAFEYVYSKIHHCVDIVYHENGMIYPLDVEDVEADEVIKF